MYWLNMLLLMELAGLCVTEIINTFQHLMKHLLMYLETKKPILCIKIIYQRH